MQEQDMRVPAELEETVSRLIFVLQNHVPRLLSRGISQTGLPKPLQLLAKGFLNDNLKLAVTATAAMTKHPSEDRLLTRPELVAWAQELTASFAWAFGDLLGEPAGSTARAADAWAQEPAKQAHLRELAQGG